MCIISTLVMTASCDDGPQAHFMRMPLERLYSDARLQELVREAVQGHVDRVKELVASGVDVNSSGKGGVTPLIALLFNAGSRDGYQALLELGADPNVVMINGQSAMNQAAQLSDPWWIQLAIEHGGNVDLINEGHPFGFGNRTPLFYAISARKTESAKTLIDRGANINHIDEHGHTPVECAVASGNFEVAHYLIERGAKLDGRTGEENTNVLEYVIERNADWFRKSPINTPEDLEWFDKILDLLKSRGIDVSPID